MKRIDYWVALALALAPAPAAAQGTFEGAVTYRTTGPGGQSGELKFSQKGNKVRQEMLVGPMPGVAIYDGSTQQSIMLMPQQKKYMVFDYGKMSQQMRAMGSNMPGARGKAPNLADMKVTPTGRRETIAGVECEHYLFQAKDDDTVVDICGASGMGFTGFAGGAGGAVMPDTKELLHSGNPEIEKLAQKGFFTLSLKMGEGDDEISLLATQLDRRSLDDALFAPPADYEKVVMPGGGSGR